MLMTIWSKIKSADWLLFVAILCLSALSSIILYGISINPISPDPSIFYRHMIYVILGIVTYFVLSSVNYRLWTIYNKLIFIGGAIFLVAVLALGVTIRGTTGWISLGFGTIQPVEFAKIALIIFLAKYFSDHGRHFFMWRHTLISGAATLLYVGLVLKQPDLGSAIVMFGSWFLMLIIAGVPRKHLMILLMTFVLVCGVAWFAVLKDYQKNRIMVFLNPQADVLNVGYNVRQSVIAVGSGRVFGRGFALGSQSQLKFLPEAETDFIFAVLAEEFGFVGVVLLFAGLLVILYRLLMVAHRTADNFAAYFAIGLASLLIVQSFINIGMNIGIAPVTGIPLPFISAGGSSLLAFCGACGIISSVVSDARSLRKA